MSIPKLSLFPVKIGQGVVTFPGELFDTRERPVTHRVQRHRSTRRCLLSAHIGDRRRSAGSGRFTSAEPQRPADHQFAGGGQLGGERGR